MNASELADMLMVFDSGQVYNHATEIATMLRQQQAEIDSLQKNLDVALMIVNEPAKTLTDKEIIKTAINWAKENHADIFTEPTEDEEKMLCSLIRAILRKAQEK